MKNPFPARPLAGPDGSRQLGGLEGICQTRWTMRWEPSMNAGAATIADRMPEAEDG